MGANGAKSSSPMLGWNRPMTVHELSPHHHGLPNLTTPRPAIQGQKTMPVSGAPRVPANPLLAMFLRGHKR
jgi:hypothetical protein